MPDRLEYPPLSPYQRRLQEALRDHYVLQKEIGAGAMGTVFKAHDLKHDRTVAIKVLRAETARSIGLDRFEREIHTAANLTHPNIVALFDSGSVDEALYFVMPYIAGETLRERLNRENRLPLGDVVRITEQLASALHYAHGSGVVHRDIKPENILLSGGHAWLVDFGVARAFASARVTATGLIVGSPQYVSPEQARGEVDVDGRADIYSLGCVVYEMLAGKPPFEARTLEAVLLRQLKDEAVSVREVRRDVPAQMASVVDKMIAKDPAHRFQNGEEIESALGGAPFRLHRRRRYWPVAAAVAAVLLVGAGVYAFDEDYRVVFGLSKSVSLDSLRYAVMPFEGPNSLKPPGLEQQVSDELSRWAGLDVVEHERVAAVYRHGNGNREALRAAKEFNAGRVVGGAVTRVGDSLRVFMELHDAVHGQVVSKGHVTFAANDKSAIAEVRGIARSLLLHDLPEECTANETGGRSLSSLQSCAAAFSKLSHGDIVGADSTYELLLKVDPHYARAALWLAISKAWIVLNTPDTKPLLSVAMAGGASLTDRENDLLLGESLLQNGRYQAACDVYRGLVKRDSLDYVAWLGSGECRRRDPLVIKDSRSPSTWLFRSSRHAGVTSYQRAFEINPSVLAAYRQQSYSDIRRVLYIHATQVVEGVDAAGKRFKAVPQLAADSIVLYPVPVEVVAHGGPIGSLSSRARLGQRQRDVFGRIVGHWLTTEPTQSAALEARALVEQLSGEPKCVESIRRARQFASSDAIRFELAAQEAFASLQFGIPDRPQFIRRSRVLADSLVSFAKPTNPGVANSLASLALLAQRPIDAARFSRLAAGPLADQLHLPVGLVAIAQAVTAFAAAGAFADSMRSLESDFEGGLRNLVAGDLQDQTRAMLLAQSAMIAYPIVTTTLARVASSGMYTSAEAAFVRGDTVPARRLLIQLAIARGKLRPADLTPDALLLEAQMLRTMKHRDEAAAHIDPLLNAVQWFEPGKFNDAPLMGTLIRLIELRSQLAAESGDHSTDKKWKSVVAALRP